MSLGNVAGLIAAIAFVVLVALLAVPLLKLGKVLDEARRMVSTVTDETVPLLNEGTTTVGIEPGNGIDLGQPRAGAGGAAPGPAPRAEEPARDLPGGPPQRALGCDRSRGAHRPAGRPRSAAPAPPSPRRSSAADQDGLARRGPASGSSATPDRGLTFRASRPMMRTRQTNGAPPRQRPALGH